MASKRTFKRHLNEMVFDIVEECFFLQLTDESKMKDTDKLIRRNRQYSHLVARPIHPA